MITGYSFFKKRYSGEKRDFELREVWGGRAPIELKPIDVKFVYTLFWRHFVYLKKIFGNVSEEKRDDRKVRRRRTTMTYNMKCACIVKKGTRCDWTVKRRRYA